MKALLERLLELTLLSKTELYKEFFGTILVLSIFLVVTLLRMFVFGFSLVPLLVWLISVLMVVSLVVWLDSKDFIIYENELEETIESDSHEEEEDEPKPKKSELIAKAKKEPISSEFTFNDSLEDIFNYGSSKDLTEAVVTRHGDALGVTIDDF